MVEWIRRIWNSELTDDIEAVLQRIADHIQAAVPHPALAKLAPPSPDVGEGRKARASIGALEVAI